MQNDNQLIFEVYENSRSLIPTRMEIPNGVAYVIGDNWKHGGIWHREDGPAFIGNDGALGWFCDDKLYETPSQWAKAVLIFQHKPSDPESVQEFLRPILAKQTSELL